MSGWVRLWYDMPTDPKWRTIARKSGQPLASVIALFTLLMVNAGENTDERGTLRGWDSEDAAAALDMDVEAVCAIIDAMQGKVLDGEKLTGWERRQPKRDDNSLDRVRAYRERKREEAFSSQRTETLGNDDVTQRNAPVTQRNAPEAEAEEEKEYTPPTPPPGGEKRKRKRTSDEPLAYTPDFEAWWLIYPRKVGKAVAFEAYGNAVKRAGAGGIKALMEGAKAYRAHVAGKEESYIAHPTTWLNRNGWEDEYGAAARGLLPHQFGRDRLGVGG